MRNLVEAILEVIDARVLLHDGRYFEFESLVPIQVARGLLIFGISARDDHFGVRELQVQAEPPGELANEADRDRAFLAAEAVVHDPGERGFAGAVVATDDVDLAGLERDDARAEIRVFRPQYDFENGQLQFLEPHIQCGDDLHDAHFSERLSYAFCGRHDDLDLIRDVRDRCALSYGYDLVVLGVEGEQSRLECYR